MTLLELAAAGLAAANPALSVRPCHVVAETSGDDDPRAVKIDGRFCLHLRRTDYRAPLYVLSEKPWPPDDGPVEDARTLKFRAAYPDPADAIAEAARTIAEISARAAIHAARTSYRKETP